jgi:hypothetical protein
MGVAIFQVPEFNFQPTILVNQIVQLKEQLTTYQKKRTAHKRQFTMFFSSQTMTKLHVA